MVNFLINISNYHKFHIKEKNMFFNRCSFTTFQKSLMRFKFFFCSKNLPDNLLTFKNKVLVVEKAPEPNDVLWENLHYPMKYKLKKRFGIYAVTLIILAICFGMILGISYGQVMFYRYIMEIKELLLVLCCN